MHFVSEMATPTHIGQGVILATAFIHLLKDAFRNMAKAGVDERWGEYESWPGLIMCVCLDVTRPLLINPQNELPFVHFSYRV